jgi:hypothetical protein
MNYKELIKALRSGTVPRDGASEIFVGHDQQISELMHELRDVKDSNASSIRFIQGNYGSGKTMITSYLVEQALQMNYCVSHIVIDPTLQLGNFDQVYRSFCQNLRSPQSQNGSGLINILENWSLKQLRTYQKVEGIDASSVLNPEQERNYISFLEKELVAVRNIEPSLSRAIAHYAGGKIKKNSELSKYALDWIRANDNVPSKEYANQLQLKGKISRDDAYKFLIDLLLIIREAEYSGTLIIFDEVETIRNIPQKNIRIKAYTELRHIIDDISAGRFASTLLLVTATPELFNNRTGIKEYPALEDRIKQIFNNGNETSNKQPIIELQSIGFDDLKCLAEKIKVIHGESEEWNISNRVSDLDVEKITQNIATGTMGIQESDPREFIRKTVEIFDLLKKYPDRSIDDLIPDIGN